MIVVRNLQATHQIHNPEIRDLVQQRIEDLGGATFDSDALGYFLVIEAGDSIQAIHAQVGFDVLHNRFSGVRYDWAGFTPSFEFVEDFPACYDMVFVLDDAGLGVELFIPNRENIDPDLIAMCRMFAFQSQDKDSP